MVSETRTTHRLLLAALLASLAAQAGAQNPPKAPKLYCWNENGRKVCGDALPPEAAGNSRTEYSKTGRRTGEVAAALTADERAAAAAAAAADAAKAESDAARLRREMAMVESYATETDLRKAFQERIDLLDETLKASELGVVGLRQSLIGLLRQAGELELAGKPVPELTRNNIATQHAELRRREHMFAQQRIDRAQLDEELASVLARYREIKLGEAPPEQAATPSPPASGG